MESQELFFPIGWLGLSKEQSAQIKSALGRSVESIPLFRVVRVSSADRFLPLQGQPGLLGVLVHYGAQPDDEKRVGQVVASLVEEMVSQPGDGRIFAAHTKLMAPREDRQQQQQARDVPSPPEKPIKDSVAERTAKGS